MYNEWQTTIQYAAAVTDQECISLLFFKWYYPHRITVYYLSLSFFFLFFQSQLVKNDSQPQFSFKRKQAWGAPTHTPTHTVTLTKLIKSAGNVVDSVISPGTDSAQSFPVVNAGVQMTPLHKLKSTALMLTFLLTTRQQFYNNSHTCWKRSTIPNLPNSKWWSVCHTRLFCTHAQLQGCLVGLANYWKKCK